MKVVVQQIPKTTTHNVFPSFEKSFQNFERCFGFVRDSRLDYADIFAVALALFKVGYCIREVGAAFKQLELSDLFEKNQFLLSAGFDRR